MTRFIAAKNNFYLFNLVVYDYIVNYQDDENSSSVSIKSNVFVQR